MEVLGNAGVVVLTCGNIPQDVDVVEVYHVRLPLWYAWRVWPAVAAAQLWRGSLPFFYFAALHKKSWLGKPCWLAKPKFFSPKKTEAGGEGSRTPVLDTFDVSISMFRRRLAALAGGPLCVSLPP